jgi:hypothetical protein
MTASQVAAAAAGGKESSFGPEPRESRRVKIEYLGSVPVDSKATDLNSLQVSLTLFGMSPAE